MAIIECNYHDEDEPGELGKKFVHINNDGLREHWTLRIKFCFQNIGSPDVNTDKLLTRAWHWLAAYLKWEDDNIDSEDSSK